MKSIINKRIVPKILGEQVLQVAVQVIQAVQKREAVPVEVPVLMKVTIHRTQHSVLRRRYLGVIQVRISNL